MRRKTFWIPRPPDDLMTVEDNVGLIWTRNGNLWGCEFNRYQPMSWFTLVYRHGPLTRWDAQ